LTVRTVSIDAVEGRATETAEQVASADATVERAPAASAVSGGGAATSDASGFPVALSVDGHVATIRLADPARRNVLDAAMARAIRAAAEEIAADDSIRCAILAGTDGAFAAGADLKEIAAATSAECLAYNDMLRAACDAIAALPMPTIAQVDGHAIGGGLELALCCTLRVAADGVKLGLPEAKLGIIPATGGLARLPRLIGAARAARLLLTGELIDAAAGERLGLVDRAVPAAEVEAETRALAARIAAVAPLAARAIVAALREDPEASVEEANDRTEARLAAILDSADRREGAAAFLARREPEFEGR
jgi:enoyl-CoA hydratase